MRPSRSSLFSSVAASLASAAGLLMLTMMPSPAQADITCTQYGTDTFHVGSTIKFQWNDTQTVQIDTFNLDLYCVQTGLLIQTLTTLNQTSPATVSWVVNSTLSAFTTQCSLNEEMVSSAPAGTGKKGR
ncbi:hypothetical protein BGZ58_001502 [Dissophora ornata]|nr:hypothetical protein BGZ58_001502 [Dissophora ornata]